MARSSRGEAHSPKNHAAKSLPPQARTSELARTIHEPIRLGLLSAFAGCESMTFNELKELLRTTDGNLSVHARKLEDNEYILCEKSFEGRMPRTDYRLTTLGRRTLETYLAHMEALIHATREG